MDRNEYLIKKFGGNEKAQKVYNKIKDAGRLVNIHFQSLKNR